MIVGHIKRYISGYYFFLRSSVRIFHITLDLYLRFVVITNRSARSGKIRKTPVMRVERDGLYLAVASRGGAPENPVWVHNLRANPQVELQDGAVRKAYVARELAGDERAQWWDYAVATWSNYGAYQKRTDRQIPIFLLEPAA